MWSLFNSRERDEADWRMLFAQADERFKDINLTASGRSVPRGHPVVAEKIISTSVVQSYVKHNDGPRDQVWMMISVVACGDYVSSLQLQK